MPDSSGAVDLGLDRPLTAEEQDALTKMAAENPPTEEEPKAHVTTAFLIVLTRKGEIQVMPPTEAQFLVSDQEMPSTDQVYGAVTSVAKDILSQQTAQTTVEFMLQQTQAMAQQQHAAQIAAQLRLPGSK